MRIMLTEQPTPGRSCGSCTLCCKVLAVPEIAKPAGHWCPQARKGTGCSIYDTRPEMCREFRCLWLQGHLSAEHKPDRIHGVVVPTKDGKNLQVMEDPGFPGLARQALHEVLQAFVADGTNYVVIVTGQRRLFLGNPALISTGDK